MQFTLKDDVKLQEKKSDVLLLWVFIMENKFYQQNAIWPIGASQYFATNTNKNNIKDRGEKN
jgi:hypothetical protein